MNHKKIHKQLALMKSYLQPAINFRSEVPAIPRFLKPETRSGGAHDFFAVESDLKLQKQRTRYFMGVEKKHDKNNISNKN